jgi:hypothetical protein
MFGYTARHIITTFETNSSPDACSPMKSKMQIDGWYIDAAFALDCDSSQAYKSYKPQPVNGCQDRYDTKQIGVAKKGYPVYEKMTMFGDDGSESFSTLNEVVEFSQATLDASLFDVPADYREVKDFASLYNTNSTSSESQPAEPSQPSQPASNTNTQPTSPATQTSPTTPATQQNTTPATEKKQESPIKRGLKSIKPKW